jgi:hypothetical protein
MILDAFRILVKLRSMLVWIVRRRSQEMRLVVSFIILEVLSGVRTTGYFYLRYFQLTPLLNLQSNRMIGTSSYSEAVSRPPATYSISRCRE